MSRVVLVVDDDPDVREVLTAMLEDIGCDVVTAETGFEALEQISRNRRVEVLITDVNMPGMSGEELAQRASRVRPDLHIMLLSGRERRRGPFPLIRKPFLQQDLAAAMVQETGRAC
ncbi:MAG: response regulator [Acetobacteraceae bacterium]|nr:response regulator [Acetobacteraceae bacterium]